MAKVAASLIVVVTVVGGVVGCTSGASEGQPATPDPLPAEPASSPEGGVDSGSTTMNDGGRGVDGGNDGGRPSNDAGPIVVDGGPAFDGGRRDAGLVDAGLLDGGPRARLEQNTAWEWRLGDALDAAPSVESLAIGMIDLDMDETASDRIEALSGAGLYVVCYFSAGTAEEYRDDLDILVDSDLGETLPEWQDERWLDVRSSTVRALALSRIERAAEKGCDGVEPDNVDAFANNSGFPLTASDQEDFNRFLATRAHANGLSVGLKNDVEQVAVLVEAFDWALNEECLTYDECDAYGPFIAANKPVFHVEYVDTAGEGASHQATVCSNPNRFGLESMVKTWDLDTARFPCPLE